MKSYEIIILFIFLISNFVNIECHSPSSDSFSILDFILTSPSSFFSPSTDSTSDDDDDIFSTTTLTDTSDLKSFLSTDSSTDHELYAIILSVVGVTIAIIGSIGIISLYVIHYKKQETNRGFI